MSEWNGEDVGNGSGDTKPLETLVAAVERVLPHLEDFASQFDYINNEPRWAMEKLEEALEPFRVRASTHGLMDPQP